MQIQRAALRAVGALVLAVPAATRAASQGVVPPGANPGDAVGFAVAGRGERLAVGAPQVDLGAASTGRAWLSVLDAQGARQWTPLDPPLPAAGGRFGHGVALGPDALAVLEPGPAGALPRVHLYDLPPVAPTATLVQSVVTPHPVGDDAFGASLDLDATHLVVGACADDGAGPGAGAVHVYRRVAGTWTPTQVLRPAGLGAYDHFGCSVALDGDRLLVGAWADDDGGPDAGAAYLFGWSGGAWVELEKWVEPLAGPADHAGASVALSGALAAVGVPGADDAHPDGGAVVVHARGSAGWVRVARHADGRLGPGAALGAAVDADAGLLVAGAPLCATQGAASGAYLAWRRTTSGIEPLGPFLAQDGGPAAYLGLDLALGAHDLWVGSFGAAPCGVPSGGVLVHPRVELAGGGATVACTCDAGPCGNDAAGRGCLHSGGVGARLGRTGSTSLGRGDLTFTVEGLPGGCPTVLVSGQPGAPTPFHDGWRCVALAARTTLWVGTSPVGAPLALGSGPALAAQATSPLPGSTTAVQVWYLDPGGPCGSGANASNALLLTWVP